MFSQLLTAILRELVQFLNQNSASFAAEGLKLPKPFQDYLKNAEEKIFLKDVGVVVTFINTPKETSIHGNAFFKAFVEFLTGPFAMRVEIINESSTYNEEDRRTVAQKLIPSDNGVGAALRHLLLGYSYQELASAIHDLCQKTIGAPYLVVQSPREVNLELKKEIREALTKEFPSSFPIFQINRNLIGGIRIFKGGAVLDRSWIGRVQHFTSLTTA